MHWLAVAIGGALGASARYAVSTLAHPIFFERLPLGTLIVNIAGSFFVGLLYVIIVERGLLNDEWRNLLMIGFLGSFTTFSAFSLEALALWQNGHFAMAISYVMSSVLLCLLATFVAIWLARLI